MFKKISLAAFAALSTSAIIAPPASAFDTGCVPVPGVTDCTPPTDIPPPPAILAALGMGFAGLRKKNQDQDAE